MPTTDKRQIVINKVKTALALILVASGYYSNLGQKVTEGKVNPYDSGRVDGVDVIDPNAEIEDMTEAEELEEHTVTIRISTIAKNPVTPEIARQHIADVRKAVRTMYSDSWCAENLDNIRNISNEHEIEQAGSKIIGTVNIFEIVFKTLKLQES